MTQSIIEQPGSVSHAMLPLSRNKAFLWHSEISSAGTVSLPTVQERRCGLRRHQKIAASLVMKRTVFSLTHDDNISAHYLVKPKLFKNCISKAEVKVLLLQIRVNGQEGANSPERRKEDG